MKQKKVYDKLVRDRIPEIIDEAQKTCVVRQVEGAMYQHYILKKLQEEVEEFVSNPCAEEAADILEVLETICKRSGIAQKTIKAERIAKRSRNGGFDMGFVLEWVEEE